MHTNNDYTSVLCFLGDGHLEKLLIGNMQLCSTVLSVFSRCFHSSYTYYTVSFAPSPESEISLPPPPNPELQNGMKLPSSPAFKMHALDWAHGPRIGGGGYFGKGKMVIM